MRDYSKFTLKNDAELTALFAGRDRFFVIGCNKCFKTLQTTPEPEVETLCALVRGAGKTVTGSLRADFLCSGTMTEKELLAAIPAGTEHILVAACGVGVQTVAAAAACETLSAADTLAYGAQHGMALTERQCGACAQCFLNLTGGICPVADCSKGLLNGPCGGARDGKCEADSTRDCAWERIFAHLKAQGRVSELTAAPVQLRNYAAADTKKIREYVREIRERRAASFSGGIHPPERKEATEGLALRLAPVPETLVLPLSMHAGAPAVPLVQPGDRVLRGEKIAEGGAFVSASVHSPVSGTVLSIEERLHPIRGTRELAVIIYNDGRDELHPSVRPHKPLAELAPEEIIDIVREAGIVGMGGAAFPTHVKLRPGKAVDTVLINGCECESVLTADHRLLLEYPEDILFGLRAAMKAVSAARGVIALEENKKEAAERLRALIGAEENIEIAVLPTQYPQGAEKMLIKAVLGRSVPRGGLPADAGAVVLNAATARAVAQAIRYGLPLTERAVTLSGEMLARPGNYIVRIGTPVRGLIALCGGLRGGDVCVKMGGDRMGTVLTDTDVPVIKGTNGILAVEHTAHEARECIRCGRCADVCPMELKPLYFPQEAEAGEWESMRAQNVTDCIECRCCEYVCPADIPHVSAIRAGKAALKGGK